MKIGEFDTAYLDIMIDEVIEAKNMGKSSFPVGADTKDRWDNPKWQEVIKQNIGYMGIMFDYVEGIITFLEN